MGQRAIRFAKMVQEELSEILLAGIKDPRVQNAGFLTITHVTVSDDLGVARVLITLHDGDAHREQQLIRGLESARPFLQRELMKRMRAKKVPELRFAIDKTDAQAERVEALLREIASGNGLGNPQ